MPGRRALSRGLGRRAGCGFTLVELMFALGLFLLLAAMAMPQLLAAVDRARARAAARYLAARMARARAEAVARSSTVALRFPAGSGTFETYVDGNHNGVRSSDIESGVDPPLEPPVSVESRFPGVAISSAAFGPSGILSFTSAGSSSSGTLFLRGRDGSQYGVRVLGATGRTRVLWYDTAKREFIETF